MSIKMLLASALLAAGLVACGGDDPEVVVPMYRGEPNGDDAALVGTLVVNGPCLLVDVDDSEPMLIAFPADYAEWNDGGRELALSGDTFRVGDRITFGGSARPANQVTADWATRPPGGCDGDWIWMSQATARLAPKAP